MKNARIIIILWLHPHNIEVLKPKTESQSQLGIKLAPPQEPELLKLGS